MIIIMNKLLLISYFYPFNCNDSLNLIKVYNILSFIVCFTCLNYSWSQTNIPPSLDATGNQSYCPLSQVNIVTDFNIVDPDDIEIDAIKVQISTGYVAGEDLLTLTGVHPNIVTSWNITEGQLTLSGIANTPILYTDVITAIKNIVFSSSSVNVSGEKYFSFNIGDANYLPSTGHYYEYVPDSGITWSNARINAATRTYFGLQGYLATIGSPEEAQLSGEQAAGAGWLGGTDEVTEGVWEWVTGPEAGTVFWNGGSNGSTPNYANWNGGEPNNLGDEDYVHVTFNEGTPGTWNDLPNIGGEGNYFPQGYIVEYGGMPGDPVLDISASTIISVPTIIETIDSSRCGNGSVVLEATTSLGTAVWFDSQTSGLQIGSGSVFNTPILSNTTIFYVLASVNGCLEGVRTPVMATVNEIPIVQSSIIFKNCDEDDTPDGYTDFNLGEINEIITNGNTTDLTFSYYLSFIEADDEINPINPSPFNNITSNTVYVRVENVNGCYSISTVNLQVSTTSFSPGFMQELNFCDDDGVNDGFHVFDLTQASAIFIAEFPLGQNLSVHYFRNLIDTQLEQNEIISQTDFVNETPFSQVLYVRVESDDNGECFGIGPHLNLKVHLLPVFEVEQTAIYCLGNQPITLITLNPSGVYNYEWKDADGFIISNLPTAEISAGGNYTVVATSNFGCESNPVSFTTVESAIANIGNDDITIEDFRDNNTITISNANNNLGIGEYEFALDNILGSYQDESFFSNVPAGVHTIYVRDKSGCGIAQLEIFVLGFPKFFTPNNDGFNDTWNIKGFSNQFTQKSTIFIYDRYGKLIKQINPSLEGWNGLFNGYMLSSSDYWFVAKLVDQTGVTRILRGHFSLIR